MTAWRLDLLRPLLLRFGRYYLYHLISVFLGALYFTVLVSLLALGISLIIFWVGILILLLTVGVSWYFARLDRKLTVALLDADIPPLTTPDARDNSTFQRLKTHVTNPLTWKSMAYLLVKMTYAITATLIVSFLLGMTLDGLTALFLFPFGADVIMGGVWDVTEFGGALLKFLVALPLAVVTYLANDWLSRLWRMFAEYMLAPTGAASQAAPAPAIPVPITMGRNLDVTTAVPINDHPPMTTVDEPEAASPPSPAIEPAVVQPVEPESVVIEDLTEREVEVLGLLAQGLSNREIADKIYVTEGTVKRHTHNIYRKIGASNRTQAVAIGRQAGLLVDRNTSTSDSTP